MQLFRSFLRVRRELNVLLAVALIIVLSMDVVLRDIPELFPKGAALGEAIYRLCLSFIASYVFYFVVIHLKAERDRRNTSAYLFKSITGILVNATNLMRNIVESSAVAGTEEGVTDAILFDALTRIGPYDAVTKKTYEIGIANPNWTQYLSYFERRCLANISEAFEQISLLDSELIRILGDLRHSSLFVHLDIARTGRLKNANFETMYEAFHEYFLNCARLREYGVSRLLPYYNVKNPDFYQGLVPFKLDANANQL